MNVRSSDGASSSENVEDVFERRKDEDIDQYGRKIFDHVFGYNIELALSNEETWKNRNRPKPIYSKDVLSDELAQQNGNLEKNRGCDDELSVSSMTSLGMKNPQDIWSLRENYKIFLEALRLFFTKREKVFSYTYLDLSYFNIIFISGYNIVVLFLNLSLSRRLAI